MSFQILESYLHPLPSRSIRKNQLMTNNIFQSNPVMLETDRWNYNHPEAVHYVGTLPGLTLFDAQFFKVNFRQGNVMDTMSRKLLEHTYQAIYDAGKIL